MKENNSTRRFSLELWLQKSGATVYNTLKRFPLTAVFLVALAALFIYQNETSSEKLQLIGATLNRIMGTLVLGVALSLCASMVKERLSAKLSTMGIILIYGLQLVLMFLFYQFIFVNTAMVPSITLSLSTAALLLGFIFIPYLFDNKGFEIYVIRLITKAAVSAFFTLSLSVGIVAVLASIKALLIADLNTDLYLYTFVITWLVFAPIHFLSSLPKQFFRYKLKDYNWVLKIALTYIALPLLSIYTVILYLYFAKVLITQSWPSGIVSYLVVAYSAIGIATVFFLWPYKKSNKWINLFTISYIKVIFPLLAMMFVAIGLRIGQYGFTENRYFILIIGIWSTLVMLFINFNKGKNNNVFLISLALALIISVYGPVNAFNTSKISQNNRLTSILNTYNMIENGQVVNKNVEIAELDKREISNILSYFERNHSLTDVPILPADYKTKEMKTYFGFESYNRPPNKDTIDFYYNRGDQPIPITGYDILFDFFANPNSNDNSTSDEFISSADSYRLIIRDSMLTISKNDQPVYNINLNQHAKLLYNKHGLNHNFTIDDFSFIDENEVINIKIIYAQVNGNVDSITNEISLRSAQGRVLVRIKNE